MRFIDTHTHMHQSNYPIDADIAFARANKAGVKKFICVGADQISSNQAVDMAAKRSDVWASVGVHPHEAKHGIGDIPTLAMAPKVVAIGECGLDYFYLHSSKSAQKQLLREHLALASELKLPVIFHIRQAFDDFWPIFDEFNDITGVVHSFSDSPSNLEMALKKGLFIGVNGIATFSKDPGQIQAYQAIPLNKLMLETDAPYLTPVPLRGKVNESAFVTLVAERIAILQSVTLQEIADTTSKNAENLFSI